MNFSVSKAKILKPQKEKAFSTFLIALLTAMAFFIPYIIIDGGTFTFYGDFNAQQIPFYTECHRAVRAGEIFWSQYTDLGSNFIGAYSFYLLGSPFFWITLPFPTAWVPYFIGPLLILKFALSALTGYLFIRRFTRTPAAAELGGLMYAFSGFAVYNIFFNHFHEAIVFFPLLLLSLEQLVTENKRFFFALMVGLCALTNYYFFFGMFIFLLIYYFVRVFTGAYKFKFSRFLCIWFEGILGVALAAFILLPSILAVSGNPRVDNILMGWSAIMYGKEQIYGNILECFFFPPDIPARPVFFPGAKVQWSSLGGWLPLFSTVGIFALFKNRKKHWLKTLIGICIFIALVPFLNSAFSAFNTAFYTRWFYMPILMISLATVMLTEDNSVDWKPSFKWVMGITVAISLVIGLFPREKDENGKVLFGLFSQGSSEEDFYMYLSRFIITCFIAIMSLVILGFTLKLIKKDKKLFFKTATACVCIITIVYANFYMVCGRSHATDAKDVVINQLINGEINLPQKDKYRVETYGGPNNATMFLGYSGNISFHSTISPSIMEFYDYIGIERTVNSEASEDYYALRSLFSVKYLINSKHSSDSFVDTETGETAMPGYNYLKTEDDFYIYENENYIPYGFSYDYYMTEEFCEGFNNEQRASMMLKAVVLNKEQIKKYAYMFKDIETDEDISFYSEGETSLSTDYDTFSFDCEKLKETASKDFKYTKNGFTATVSRDKESLVFFSIPYDKGFTATINGKPAQIENVNHGFMAVKVKAGESKIEFKYMTPGLNSGLIITTFAALIFLIYILSFALWSRTHKKDTIYPEGEQLLKAFKKWEIEEQQKMIEAEEALLKPSILDIDTNISVPSINEGFENGFKINPDAINDSEE